MTLQIRIKTLIPKYAKAGKTGSIGAKMVRKTEIFKKKKEKIFAHRATKCDFTSIFIAISGL